MHKILSQFDN